MEVIITIENTTASIVTTMAKPDTVPLVVPRSDSIKVTIALSAGLLGLLTVLGNMFIIISVPIVRQLREPSNFLYVSMACADFCVGILVVSLACSFEVHQIWLLGAFWCNFWTYSDVLLCTASILHLCVVSIDRYLVIKHPLKYAPRRTMRRMGIYALCAWALSVCVSLPMLVHFRANLTEAGYCEVNPDLGYQLYATLAAFYIPVVVMMVVNMRIYATVRAIRQRDERESFAQFESPTRTHSTPAIFHNNVTDSPCLSDGTAADSLEDGIVPIEPIVPGEVTHPLRGTLLSVPNVGTTSDVKIPLMKRYRKMGVITNLGNKPSFKRLNWKRVQLKKDTKAVKTLLVITGAFVICWLPFFLNALINSICQYHKRVVDAISVSCMVPEQWQSISLWLGYTNSALNPILIVLFNKDFKRCIRARLRRSRRTGNSSLRSDVSMSSRDHQSNGTHRPRPKNMKVSFETNL